ncbi:MAG: DUF6439 family protein [Cyanobacteria bacterium J06629_19]
MTQTKNQTEPQGKNLNSAETQASLKSFSTEELAQALAQKLAIAPADWHRLSANRAVRAREQAAAALVYMLKDNPEEALPRLTQAIGWLNKTLKAPPCPTHGEKRKAQKN